MPITPPTTPTERTSLVASTAASTAADDSPRLDVPDFASSPDTAPPGDVGAAGARGSTDRRILYVSKAQSIPGGDRVPDLEILAVRSCPELPAGLPVGEFQRISGERYAHEAGRLADALLASLPGGTLDRLVADLLYRRASHLAVSRAGDAVLPLPIARDPDPDPDPVRSREVPGGPGGFSIEIMRMIGLAYSADGDAVNFPDGEYVGRQVAGELRLRLGPSVVRVPVHGEFRGNRPVACVVRTDSWYHPVLAVTYATGGDIAPQVKSPQVKSLKEGEAIQGVLEGRGPSTEFTQKDQFTGQEITRTVGTWIIRSADGSLRVSILSSVQLDLELPALVGEFVRIYRGKDLRTSEGLLADYLVGPTSPR